MARMPGVPFVAPRSFSSGRPDGPPRHVCIHYTAGAEGPAAAEDGAAYDQRRTDGTSAHFYIDSNSVVQCVDTGDRAHTARHHGNLHGIHLELCGTAQTRAQWLDGVSRATIRNAARVCAWAMRIHGIPLQRVTGREVRTDKRGLCGHVDYTTGWPEDGGTHTDPGPAFPWDVLFDDIRSELEGDMELGDSVNLPQDRELNPTGQAAATVGLILGYDLLRAARTYDISKRLEAKINALADAVGAVLPEVDGVEEELASIGAQVGQVKAIVEAIQAGDPSAIAQQLADLLGPELAAGVADTLAARLAE